MILQNIKGKSKFFEKANIINIFFEVTFFNISRFSLFKKIELYIIFHVISLTTFQIELQKKSII